MSAIPIVSSSHAISERRIWIISKRDDLLWFIGSSLLGYLAFFLLNLGVPVLSTFIVWSLLIDGPHVFATASRTYFDRKVRERLGWHLWLIIPLSFIGPAFWTLGLGGLFFVLFITWAQYHVAKQHVGFVMLYKRKAGERSDITLDRRFLVVSLMLPWALYVYATLNLAGTRQVTTLTVLLYIVGAIFYFRRQLRRAAVGEAYSIPKLLLLLVVIPIPWLAFVFANGRPEGFAIATIATNIGHSLQYQRLTWFHNRNRYAAESRSTIGLASIINSRLAIYFLTAVVLNLLFAVLPNAALYGNERFLTALVGVNMAHYYLDSIIWRVRSDKDLATALRL